MSTRLLAILELLQSHGRLSGSDLSTRLATDPRTIRRDIARLEAMGIPITTERGPHGGYELVAGYKLPPLLFTNAEALVIALGLTAVRAFGLAAAPDAIASAQAKLERVLPPSVQQQVRALTESVALAPLSPPTPSGTAALSALSTAAHTRRGVRLHYRAPNGETTERDFDPYGLAFRSAHWYTVGHCHLRRALRSFRLDRVIDATPQPRPFHRPAEFDILAHLSHSLATLPRKYTIEVILHTDLESARRELFPAIGILEPQKKHTLLRAQADDLRWFARELARLPWRIEVLRPAPLRRALHTHARSLVH